jgi:Holliday junction resolvasome RuvABC ATP-dependent DNA helicase subunit
VHRVALDVEDSLEFQLKLFTLAGQETKETRLRDPLLARLCHAVRLKPRREVDRRLGAQ